jgi:hypothetical protein
MKSEYLESVIKQMEYYKSLGEKAMGQVSDPELFWEFNEESNSIAVVVKHLSGNMLSRWTDFLSSDGEKEWRDRDAEFQNDLVNKDDVWEAWNKGWDCFLSALKSLGLDDLEKTVYIRNQGHTVMEAINRQLCHYSYHVGQIVLLAKMKASKWESLSIPKNRSKEYNKDKFSQEKSKTHFTDEFLKENKHH